MKRHRAGPHDECFRAVLAEPAVEEGIRSLFEWCLEDESPNPPRVLALFPDSVRQAASEVKRRMRDTSELLALNDIPPPELLGE